MHGAPALPEMIRCLSALCLCPTHRKAGGHEGALDTFNSLNPLIVQGLAVQPVRGYVVESLMARSYDEPFTLYGLLARTVETDAARSYVTFTLDPAAHFSDGTPVTAEDVMFSWQLLRDHGRPNHRTYYSRVAKAEISFPRHRALRFRRYQRPCIVADPRPHAGPAETPHRCCDVREIDAGRTDRQRSICRRRCLSWKKRHLHARSQLLGLRASHQSRSVEFR